MRRTVLLSFIPFFVLLPVSIGISQTSQPDSAKPDFWQRLEYEVERFVKKAAGGFIDPEDGEMPTRRPQPNGGIHYSGDTIIEAGDTVHGDVTFRNGRLKVYGVIDGNVVGMGGTLYVHEGGVITGNVRLVNGDVVKDDNAVISGGIDLADASALAYDVDKSQFPGGGLHVRAPWMHEKTDLGNLIFRYNRIEGLFLGLGSDKKYYWDGSRDFTAYGSFGYGFKVHRWALNLGAARQIPLSTSTDQLLEFGLEGYTFTDSKDRWLINVNENTAAAFLIREDFRDYYWREGISPHIGYYHRGEQSLVETKVAFHVDRYESLVNKTEWSLFGGKKRFRENPLVDDGRMRSILATVGYSSVAKRAYVPHGWSLHASVEFADRGTFGGEFTFNRYLADIRRYQPIGRYDNLNLRLRAGTAHGTLPRQKSYELGGLGTLPGYSFKEFPGTSDGANRMLLLNAEYIINGDFLHDLSFWPSWLMRHINLVFLADAGLVRSVSPDASFLDGFGGIKLTEFKSDLGIGVANRSGSFRIGAVWRTDRAEPPNFFLRFSRPF